MASFFSPIQQHGQGLQQSQQTPPPPGLQFNLPMQQHQQHQQQQHGALGGISGINSIPNGRLNGYGHGGGGHDMFSTAVGQTSSHPAPSAVPGSIREQVELWRSFEKERENLIIHLAKENEDLRQKLEETRDDLAAEQQSRRREQQRAKEAEQALESQRGENTRIMASNPFVFVIIDGDGAIFSDALLAQGTEGGVHAASALKTGIQAHLQAIYQTSSVEDWGIVVQVVLNLDGLAKKLMACNIISSFGDLSNFSVGFNRSQHLFSFIDVGHGKERADHKIRENFRLFSRMGNCKHLYFGPCHDNGYLPFLEPYLHDSFVRSKLTLIEATPAEPGFLNYDRVRFEDVFRSEMLPAKPVNGINAALTAVATAAVRRSSEMAAAAFSASTPPVATKPPSNSSASPQQPASATPAPSSWAAMSKSGASTGKTIDIAPAKKPPKKYILLNSDYERLDEQLPPAQQQYVKRFNDRIKERNCCNNYHLKGHCNNGDSCNFQHGDRLSEGEQRVLRHKARSIKCNSSSWCEDFDCPYGHRCKFGGKECGHDDCRFFDTHHVDPRPAYKKYEDGTYEAV